MPYQLGTGNNNWTGTVYVATPALLRQYGIKPSQIAAGTDLLTMRPGLSGYRNMVMIWGRYFNPNGLPPPCTVSNDRVANPKIQEFMPAHSLKNNADLQAYFNTRIQKLVAKHGKTMEGWDEILRPDLPKSIVIHSWRGQKSLGEAAQQGYRGHWATQMPGTATFWKRCGVATT